MTAVTDQLYIQQLDGYRLILDFFSDSHRIPVLGQNLPVIWGKGTVAGKLHLEFGKRIGLSHSWFAPLENVVVMQ
ncbi:hypothetical protein D3C81_1952100 [compost metagenome]